MRFTTVLFMVMTLALALASDCTTTQLIALQKQMSEYKSAAVCSDVVASGGLLAANSSAEKLCDNKPCLALLINLTKNAPACEVGGQNVKATISAIVDACLPGNSSGSAATSNSSNTESPTPAATKQTTTTVKAENDKRPAGVVFGVVLVLIAAVVVAVFVWKKRRAQVARTKPPSIDSDEDLDCSPAYELDATKMSSPLELGTPDGDVLRDPMHSDPMASCQSVLVEDQMSPWNDPEIAEMRVPVQQITIGQLISRGAFGEVYCAKHNGKPVAVKKLHPDMRSKLSVVRDFFREAKHHIRLCHPHIVDFQAIAWTNLRDVCMVVEYMPMGNLRTLLDRYDRQKRDRGFTSDKVKIALHVVSALKFLHLAGVLHRDLKSKNVLLNDDLDAKLSDFGISRERSDIGMTTGVGSSLWMAPELLRGDVQYSEKVDMFAFGVVLSELDTHEWPYAFVKHERDSDVVRMRSVSFGARQRPVFASEFALLDQVVRGSVSVSFSEPTEPESGVGVMQKKLAELGLACVSVDPDRRPSAEEAYELIKEVFTFFTTAL